MPLSALTLQGLRVGLGILLMGALFLAPLPAQAAGDDPVVIDRITTLNKKALDAYNNLEFEDARKLLKQALDLCSSSGLDKHPIKARTHIHMGVVLIASKQQELGVKQFRKALDIQPDIRVTKALANPEIMQAYDEATAGGGAAEGTDGGGGEPRDAGGGGSAVKGDINMVPVTRGQKGKAVPISVTVSPALKGYTKLVLAHRREGATEFEGVDMQRSGDVFSGEIPAQATTGAVVHYFVQAENQEEDAVATAGSEEKPHAVWLTGGRGGNSADGGDGGDGDGDTEDDFRRFYFGLSAGSGTGYTRGTGELNVTHRVDGKFAPSSTAHIAPEIGYFLSPRLRLSLLFRLQYVTGRTPLNLRRAVETGMAGADKLETCGPDHLCTTGSPFAPAVFARGTWFFGSSAFRPYFSMAVGGGVIRHVLKFPATEAVCGVAGNQVCVDSVLSGPIFAGAGGGIHYALTPAFGLIAEVNALIGFPKFTAHLDFNAGAAARF